jgi:type VI secretion system protein ImpH
MAEETGDSTADRLKYLLDNARRFSFYQAIQWLQRLYAESARVGREGPADRECVRLRPSASLSFPPSDLERAEKIPDQDRVLLTTTFLGLYGSDSPLPYAYVEHVAQIALEPQGERVRAFLDILHHRLLSLLYRAWRKYRPAPQRAGKLDPTFTRVLSFIGYSRELGLGGEVFPRLSEVRLLALRHRSAAGLRFLLQKRLGYPVGVEQLLRRVVDIPPEQRSRLGAANCALGSTLVVGERITDRNKIRVQIQASTLATFMRLLPGRQDHRQIDDVLATYLRTPVDREVEVRLDREQVPPWELGSDELPLGLGLWLGRPAEDAVVRWSG